MGYVEGKRFRAENFGSHVGLCSEKTCYVEDTEKQRGKTTDVRL